MTESKWIKFEKEPVSVKRKTDIYQVWTKDGLYLLGDVRWYASWRKYCFYPCVGTVFETQCLGDIVTFINYLMAERKQNAVQETR
jgi:hypothetical protein